MFVVTEIQGAVRAMTGVGYGRGREEQVPRPAGARKGLSERRKLVEHMLGKGGEGRGGREWCRVRCSTQCQQEKH